MSYNIVPDVKSSSNQSNLAGKTANSKFSFAALPLVLLVVLSAMLIVERLSVPQIPISPDAGAYSVISHELLQGKSLYTDIWDHKPPAVFITYSIAETFFGYSSQTIFILCLFINLVVLYGLYYAGKAGRGGTVAGLLAAVLWVIVSGIFEIEGRDPNTEVFLNACLIWAFALLVKTRKNGLAVKHSLLIGMLFALGSFYKPVIVANALFLVGAHVIFPPGGAANRKKTLTDGLIIASVGVVGWIAAFGYFAATNRFEIFYKTIVSYNSYYSGDLPSNIIAPLQGRSELFLDFMNPLAGLFVVGIILTFIRNRRQSALLAAFVASTWIAIALPGHFYVHYFQLWLPPLIVGASWAIGYFTVSEKLWLRTAAYATAVLLAVILIMNQVLSYQSALAGNWSKFLNPPLVAGEDTAHKINSLLAPDETFFLWGNTPNLYLLTGRKPPAAVVFHQHLFESPVINQLSERVKTDLARKRPEMLVAEIGKVPVPDWIAQDYEPMPIPQAKDSYTFYMRRGGRLAMQFDSVVGK